MRKRRVPQKRSIYKDSGFYGTPPKLSDEEVKSLAGYLDTLIQMDMEAKHKKKRQHDIEANAN